MFSDILAVGVHAGAREEEATKKTHFVKRGFFVVCPYGPLLGAREDAKTKKKRFRKCGFFVVCPYGPLCHPCKRQGRRKNENTLCKTCFFRGLPIRASISPLLGALEEAKTKKPRFRKCGFFRGLPTRASMSPMQGAREQHLQQTVLHQEDLYIRNLFKLETYYTRSLFRPGTIYRNLAG